MRAGGFSKISKTVQGVNRSGQTLALKPKLDHKFKFNSSTKRIKTLQGENKYFFEIFMYLDDNLSKERSSSVRLSGTFVVSQSISSLIN